MASHPANYNPRTVQLAGDDFVRTPIIPLATPSPVTGAPAGGTGATGGAYDTSGHRDTAIAGINAIGQALEDVGLINFTP